MLIKPDKEAMEALELCHPHPRDERLLFTFEKAGCHAIRHPDVNGVIWRNPVPRPLRELFNNISPEACADLAKKLSSANLTYIPPSSAYFKAQINDPYRHWKILNHDPINEIPEILVSDLCALSAHLCDIVKAESSSINTHPYDLVLQPHIDRGAVAYRMTATYSGKGIVIYPGKTRWEEYDKINSYRAKLEHFEQFRLSHEHLLCETGDVVLFKGLEHLPSDKNYVPGLLHCSSHTKDGIDNHFNSEKNGFTERFQVEFHARPALD